MKRSYALGGGGSGDLVMDRSSFAEHKGVSRSKYNAGTAPFDAMPMVFGRHEAIREHVPGAHGEEQS